MLLFYILLIVYILAINFYSFLYICALHKAETQPALKEQTSQNSAMFSEPPDLSVATLPSDDEGQKSKSKEKSKKGLRKSENGDKKPSLLKAFAVAPVKGFDWKLILCATLGGAITIYVCMFLFRYKLNNLLLMVLLPILGAANAYLWIVLLTSRFFMRI